MSKTLVCHTLIKKNMFDIFVDLILIHFHYMKIHRLLLSQRRNIFRQDNATSLRGVSSYNSLIYHFQRFTI